MAITQVGSSTPVTGTSSSISITHGLTILEDDIVLAFIHVNGSISATSVGFDVDLLETSASSSRITLLSKREGASAPASYTFTLSGTNSYSGYVRVFRDVDTTTLYDVPPSDANSGTDTGASSITAPSITTLTDGAMCVMAAFSDSSGVSYSNVTNSYGTLVSVSSGRSQASALRVVATAGAVGTTDIDMSQSDDVYALQFALKPLAASGTTTALTSIVSEGILSAPSFSKESILSSLSTADVLDVVTAVVNTVTPLGTIASDDVLNSLGGGISTGLGSTVGTGALVSLSTGHHAELIGVTTSDALKALEIAGITPLGNMTDLGSLQPLVASKSIALGNVLGEAILSAPSFTRTTLLGSIIGEEVVGTLAAYKTYTLGQLVSEGVLGAIAADVPVGCCPLTDADVAKIIAAMKAEGFLTLAEYIALK